MVRGSSMVKQRARLIANGLRLVDMLMLGIAFPIAYYLRDQVLGGPTDGLYPASTYWPLLASSLLVWQLATWTTGLYGAYRRQAISTEIFRLGRAFLILAGVVAAGQFLWKQHDLSRLFVGLYYAVAFGLLFVNRVALRLVAREARRRGLNAKTFAVVGSSDMAEEIAGTILQHKEWGYAFEGFIVEDDAQPPRGGRVLGCLSEMGRVLEEHVLDEVIFSVRRDKLQDIEEPVLLCEEQGIGVKVLLNFFPARIAKLSVEEIDGIPVLNYSTTPSDAAPLVAKRIFDIVVSGLVVLLLSPFFIALAIAIKLDSPGPVFFKQRRVGLSGREFFLFKFRSMCVDAEAKLGALKAKNEMDGPVFKMREDPRVTRMGRFLRKTSMDEFPQFWNVLRGEMSVVGPRPPLPTEVKLYKRWQRRRLSVKPGITCTWQVSGRNEIDFSRWMELDLYYIDNWSLWHDTKIVLRTIPAVLLGKGAR